ncbi:YjbQ family protein [Vibrio panuliri]|uniref:Secondary thiamine-phosphate synthase n=1 Tax=Vibrio panuliri TaxID=1381081 RepID=A0A1Q9HEQ8_9VIBR|nr:YjbQ family protein [Vibrio panuliri]KAB1454637.1 YjbQ family protein [Vibrio panuliri]OLQ88207.1 secondary thiamine-phosphate synthase [Vibrio panuliri]OLQ96598.1 secondary thiamine-phosphate synthase [Vibrio panuliri]
MIYHDTITVESCAGRVSYHNITDEVKKIVELSGVANGSVLIQTAHTTCSVIFEEFVHDLDFNGDEFLQVDMNRMLDRIVPRELTENTDYRYPGPKHLEFLMSLDDPNYPCDPGTILNGDAHIRASLFGPSQQFIIKDGKINIGSVGYIYFIDFDQNRPRNRKCAVMVAGE